MRQFLRSALIASFVVAALGTTSAAWAATADGATTASGKSGVSARHDAMAHDRAGSIEQRIASLHAKLQITPAQQAQWDQFAQIMRDNAHDMESSFQTRVKGIPTMTAPENMQSYAQIAAGHATDVQKLVPAFDALYGTMSDAQKRTADQIFRYQAEHPRRGGEAAAAP